MHVYSGRMVSWREQRPRLAGALGVTIAAFVCGGLAWAIAQFGPKGILAAAGGVVFVAALIVWKDHRQEVVLGVAVLAIAALFHKKFSFLYDISSGPPSIYLTSFDVLIGLLWFTWWVSGPRRMKAELLAAVKRPIVLLPMATALTILPSLLVTPVTTLAYAELIRMTSMYLLFLFLAAHIRTRTQVWVILGGLGAIAVIEALLVAAQYVTKSPMGLSVFGTPDVLHDRGDGLFIARPFGTLAHPVFMAAFVAPLGLMALSLAINLRNRKVKAACLAVAVLAVSPVLVANARSAALGLIAGFVALVIALILVGRLPGKTVGAWVAVGVLGLACAFPYVMKLYNESFHTSHFGVEWQSRAQLNELAIRMFEAKPIIGHGLNNFEQVMDHYTKSGRPIFDQNPVHNLYLLQLSETGIIGFLGLVTLAVAMLWLSLRLARSKDRLYSAIGFGFAAINVFWFVEEMFVFSLRQDHPRALYFLLAGLVVACSRLAGLERPAHPARLARALPRTPYSPQLHGSGNGRGNGKRPGHRRPAPARRRNGHDRQRRTWSSRFQSASRRVKVRVRRRGGAGVIAVALLAGGVQVALPGSPAAAIDTSNLKITFQAVERGQTRRGIYVANGDGSGITKITLNDNADYSWPQWAFNGAKIVFTKRTGPLGGPENVFMMNPDGSGTVQLTTALWRLGQPKVAPDGRSLVFTGAWTEFHDVALYKLDLATGLVRNLSAVTQEIGAVDADPKWSADGSEIVFAFFSPTSDGSTHPSEVGLMNADGTDRRFLTHDNWFDSDPSLAPNGKSVAIASYRGPGEPGASIEGDPHQVKLQDFFLINRNLETNTEQVLTQGKPCARRPDTVPCTPTEVPAYVPVWTPAGDGIGYVGVESRTRTCICVADPNGGGARPVIDSTTLAISWFSWVEPGPPPPGAVLDPLQDAPTSRLLFTAIDPTGIPIIAAAKPDRYGQVRLPSDMVVNNARWSPDRTQVVFNAVADVPAGGPPDPPPGEYRHRHYTLSWFPREFLGTPPNRVDAEREQVYVMNANGSKLRRISTPWTEDYLDAIPDGELRGNTTPDWSPDSRYLVFTNKFTSTSESSILRYDTKTDEVLNLTNATAGAMPVTDFMPRYSPDGNQVAFATITGDSAQIAMVDSEGYKYRELTADDYFNIAPAWSPDGRYVVYASYRGDGISNRVTDGVAIAAQMGNLKLQDWYLVRLDVRTGEHRVLTKAADSPTFAPVYSPDGSQIAFISVSEPGQPDIYIMNADGTELRPLQVTHETDELYVDWR